VLIYTGSLFLEESIFADFASISPLFCSRIGIRYFFFWSIIYNFTVRIVTLHTTLSLVNILGISVIILIEMVARLAVSTLVLGGREEKLVAVLSIFSEQSLYALFLCLVVVELVVVLALNTLHGAFPEFCFVVVESALVVVASIDDHPVRVDLQFRHLFIKSHSLQVILG